MFREIFCVGRKSKQIQICPKLGFGRKKAPACEAEASRPTGIADSLSENYLRRFSIGSLPHEQRRITLVAVTASANVACAANSPDPMRGKAALGGGAFERRRFCAKPSIIWGNFGAGAPYGNARR